jgi:predicted transcriptional regulator
MKRAFTLDSIENRSEAIKDSDGLELRFFASEKEARGEEAKLIHQYHPQGNRFCSLCDFYYQKNPRLFRKEGQLFGKTKNAILSLLLENEEKAYHVREIAEITNLALGQVQRELKKLERNGILRRFSKGNKVFHQAEEQHPIFVELKSLISKGA